jgi:hypothetical protein
MYDPDTTARSSAQRMIGRNALMLSTFHEGSREVLKILPIVVLPEAD